jgi:hypothetical protein
MEEIEVDENRLLLDPSSRRGSRDVVSLKIEDPLVLIIEAVSNPRDGGGIVVGMDKPEIPDIEDAPDRNPLKCISFSSELEIGLLSG